MKLHFDSGFLMLTLSLVSTVSAADDQRELRASRRAYLVALPAEPSFTWPADKVARRARAESLVWRVNEPAVQRAAAFRRSQRDPGLVLERP